MKTCRFPGLLSLMGAGGSACGRSSGRIDMARDAIEGLPGDHARRGLAGPDRPPRAHRRRSCVSDRIPAIKLQRLIRILGSTAARVAATTTSSTRSAATPSPSRCTTVTSSRLAPQHPQDRRHQRDELHELL
jgi:hypothetical protein